MPAPPPVPSWLVPWAVWMIRGKVGARPAGAPKRIPESVIWFPAWVRWRMGGRVGRRPDGTPATIPVWAWVPASATIREVLAASPQLPSASAEREASLDFWRGMGVWVTIPSDCPPSILETFAARQYGYVIVPTLYGTKTDAGTEGLDAYVAACRARGLRVVGSQWGDASSASEAEAEADAGAEAYKRHGFDGWCINGEKRYEGGGKSGVYARRFRLRAGNSVPVLWSPEPRLALDHDALQEMGFAYGPQAYPLENNADVSYVAEWGRNFGYEARNVVPLVQAYPSPAGVRYPAAAYRAQAFAHGLPGLILYTGNQALDVPHYWRDLVL